MDGNSWTVFSYFRRAGIIQPKFIAAAQLRKILSKNAVTAAPNSIVLRFVKSAPVRSRIADRELLGREFQSCRLFREHVNVSRLIAANYRFVTMQPRRALISKDIVERALTRLTTCVPSFNSRTLIHLWFFNVKKDTRAQPT